MPQKNSKRSAPWAVVLLSGGLDSATAAAWAQARGFRVAALTVRYGQRHAAELAAARRVARSLKLEKHLEIGVELSRIGGSALTDRNLKVPKNRSAKAISTGIPITYVPARNTVFLSLALGLAETLGAQDLVLGVNVLDYSGYPDCRPAFVRAFQRLADLATKAGVERTSRFKIHTPLIRKTKAQIVRLGTRLGVDYALTTSCYAPVTRGKRVFACGRCDSCHLRLKGFAEAGRTDPVPYGAHP